MDRFCQHRKFRERQVRGFFSRENGSYGFEEFRRDIEDGGQWTPVQYYSGVTYLSAVDALASAERGVYWLVDVLAQKPEQRTRIGFGLAARGPPK